MGPIKNRSDPKDLSFKITCRSLDNHRGLARL